MVYALDTNTVILLLRDDRNVCRMFDAAVERGDEIVIPPLVHYEIIRGFLCKSVPKRENSYRILIEQYPVCDMSVESLDRAAAIYAELYRTKRTVEDADLIIAAFCIEGGYTLVTNNMKHFELIGGLITEDWSSADMS